MEELLTSGGALSGVIVFGHPTVLDRIESVEYRLPGYPDGFDRQNGGPRERLFELKELANGFCVVQAFVRLKKQPGAIRLSRLVNMSESGPRLFDDFVHRRHTPGLMVDKLKRLPAAIGEAKRLLKTMERDQVVRRLMAEGYREAMAETAAERAAMPHEHGTSPTKK